MPGDRCSAWAGLGGGCALSAAVALTSCGPSAPPSGGPIAATCSFGEVGLSPGQFSKPRCLDEDGESLWVIDFAARVQRLDAKTGDALACWQMPEYKLGKPTGVTAWRPAGADDPLIFIADTHYHRVVVYGRKPDVGPRAMQQWAELARFGEYGEGPGQFIYPTDVAIVPTADGRGISRIYVSEYGGHDRISVFEPAGTGAPFILPLPSGSEGEFRFAFAFGQYGSGSGAEPVEFNRPQSMSLDSRHQELVIADACNHRLGRFTLDGKLIKWLSGPDRIGKEAGEFAYPYGLALLGDGSALVAEFGNNRVQRIDLASGQGLGIFGQTGRGDGELSSPWAVTVVGKTAYVLDSGNNRLIGFDAPRGGMSRVSAAGTGAVAGTGGVR